MSTRTVPKRWPTELGGEAWTLDLTDRESLAGLAISTDILINNAGIQHVSPIPDFDPEMFRRILMIMVEAPFLLIRAALPPCTSGFGRIVNISSVHGLRASAYKSAYVSAKHGLEGLSKVTALEGGGARCDQQLHQSGLRPDAAGGEADRRPGQDPRHRRVRGGGEDHARPLGDQAARRARGGRLTGRLAGRPDAGMVTGASYTMDGGWTAQ